MASSTPSMVPILNFSRGDLKPGTAGWIAMAREVHKALEEFGCFEAVYDQIPSRVREDLFGGFEDLFNLPVDTKAKCVYDSDPAMNYVGPRPSAPLNEGMGIPNAGDVASISSFTTLMWPEGNRKFCESMHSYVQQLIQLEQMIKKMIYESYGLERYYPSSESTDYFLRFNLYTPQKNETRGVVAHTDKYALTILHQNQVNGFETQTKNGEWLSVNPSPNSFIVITGDLFMVWSNGRIHNPIHRVTIKGNEKRYSISFMTNNKGLTEIPEELVDEEHPLLFKPVHHMDYLLWYYKTTRAKGNNTIKDYCGV